MPKQTDSSLLEMALVGYEAQLETIAAKMSEIQARLGKAGKHGSAGKARANAGKTRVLSVAARKRIAAAQKKRWAKFHAAQKGTS